MSRIVFGGGLFLMICLGACGGGTSDAPSLPTAPTTPTVPNPPPTPVVATGDNWSFRFDGLTDAGVTGGYGKTAPLVALEGSFNDAVGSVSAVMQPFGQCFTADGHRVLFTGTRSGNTIEMQSQAEMGQVVRINATLSAAGDRVQGTYSIAGGCAAGVSGPMTGRRVDWTGVWSGMMGAIPTTIDLQMARTPDADANYVLSGSAKFSNTQCFVNAVITRRGRGRISFPDVVSDTQRLELIAELSEDLSTMHIVYVLVTGTCPELSFGDGRLVRQ